MDKKNRSKYNSYSGGFFSLFCLKDNVIYQVLKELEMNEHFSDWQDNCMGSTEDYRRTISIDGNQKNGFNNLIINQSVTKTVFKKIGLDDCDDIIDRKIGKKITLRYNGTEYIK